jgi:hypothetical protein
LLQGLLVLGNTTLAAFDFAAGCGLQRLRINME